MAKIKQDLGQLFENNSNCYADTTDDSVVMAMDKEQFVKIVTDLLTECVSADCSHEETAALPLQNVSISLRDFFAAEAMKAECISWNAEMSNEYRAKILEDMIERWGGTTVYEAIALNSYEMADNMLKAKSRNEC